MSFGRSAGPTSTSPGHGLAFGAGAATPPSRPPVTPPVPSPLAPAHPTSPLAGGGVAPSSFPSPRPRPDPAASAATGRHVARHLQPQPRLVAPPVSRSPNPPFLPRSRSPSPLSHQHVDSPRGYDNGVGRRRVVNYSDPLFENGNIQASEHMRMQHPDFGKIIRSPSSNTTGMIRSPSTFRSYPPMQIPDPPHVYKPDLSPSKIGNQNQFPIHDTHLPPYPPSTTSPVLNSNRFVAGRPRPALGGAASSSSVLGDVTYYNSSTGSMAAHQETREHLQAQRFSASLQSRSMDHNISKRSRSPTFSYQGVDVAEAHRDAGANARRLVDYTDTLIDDANAEASKRMRSPSSEPISMAISPPSDSRSKMWSSPAGFGTTNAVQNLHSHSGVQKSNASPPKFGNHMLSCTSDICSPPHHMFHHSDSYSNEHSTTRISDTHSKPHQMFQHSDSYSNEHDTTAVSPPKPAVLNAAKRSRIPPVNANEDDLVMPSTELEREKQAKAKRLARFGVELSRPVENINDFAKAHTSSADKPKRDSSMENIPKESGDDTNKGTLTDMDLSESAAIVGLCPDMCPESEREERERKGDLDRYERLDGDRNQTTQLLAVKKYNRTAERDADSIRPLPVLQKTMDYLLSLLDRTYDDSFLGLYNFLWDRMRAIRMDLRMQHFFNREAISMLEQMIRLHVIAMHELCEYNKGEGFSEGFDAHLNIEQMNKTSVELFQMYDDHRRKGIIFSTEKEFRGYYALLKLDKHPGYKVEPAELSLDLAKMSREIRGSPEILFAREVARACRIGNFIAFFRLARKATYLQACLMHAHFAKLRRQALASLHSGLQNTQGIPVSRVVDWLGMEGEEMESLLEYHGFGLRQYEEMYLVKEGSFLNSESDFPSNRSQLVHSKKSHRVINDVFSGPVSGPFALTTSKREFSSPYSSLPINNAVRREFDSPYSGPSSPSSGRQIASPYSDPFSPNSSKKQISSPFSSLISPTAGTKESISVFSGPPLISKETVQQTLWMDEQKVPSPKAETMSKVVAEFVPEERDVGNETLHLGMELQSGVPLTLINVEDDDTLAETNDLHPVVDDVSLDYSNMYAGDSFGIYTDMDEGIPPESEGDTFQIGPPRSSTSMSGNDGYGDHMINSEMADDRFPIVASPKKNEISSERLKLILRKWKQHAADKRFMREQKNALAIAALSSLSLGPPVQHTAAVLKHAVQELDIDHALRERDAKQQRSWSRLNVSELVAPILSERSPSDRCLCWKLLVLVPPGAMESQTNHLVSRWLLKKLMSSGVEDSELLVSSANLSIWTKWFISPHMCCLSVVRASDQQVVGNDITIGTGCIIFVVSESIPWELQKARFSSLLESIPAQSNLPLLIVSGDMYRDGHDAASQTISNRLGLNGLSEGKISSYSVLFLVGSYLEGYAGGFFDDDKLQECLKWLANHLPLRPAVTLVKVRELLLNYLKHSLERFNSCAASEVGPEHCISAFNDAVDHIAEGILAATYANPNQWPPLELELIERSSSEMIFAEMFLPNIGWSLQSRIQPLLATMKSCKLPKFCSDMSWLNQGTYMGRQIQNQKLTLEECLTKYVTQSARLLNETQAASEVRVMVQKGVGLELRDSSYYLVPRWVTIFWRIYNWRLVKLSTGEFSEAYILDQHLYQTPVADSDGETPTPSGFIANGCTMDEASMLEDHVAMPVSRDLSLDEIIEISCGPDAINEPLLNPLPERLPAQAREEPQAPADIDGEVNGVHDGVGDIPTSGRVQRRAMPLKRDDKLARLLEQCTKLQDRIDEKLAIYF